MKSQISIVFSASLLFAGGLYAQVDTGTILGSVKDTTGAVIPGAQVTLTNTGTGRKQVQKTGSSGEYTFSPIQIGHYTVSAQIKGFQRVEHSNVTVSVQQSVVVEFVLPPGEMVQTVVVTSQPPLLQTQNASVGQVIGQRAINSLPLNGRNYTFLAQLAAGVTQDQEDTRGLGASGSFAANGLRPSQNNYLLNGVDNNSNLVDFLNGQAFVSKPPVDAIQEFKIQTNNYSAEFGRSAGAILNATIKSGTNQLHGDAWEFLRNDKLDAPNFFENASGTTKGEYRQNQFGFTLGGPILKNKLFFFGDYAGTRIRQAVPSINTVPTALERSSGFTNLSELLTQSGTRTDILGRTFPIGQIFDPPTTRAVTCGVPDTVTSITLPCGANPAGTQLGFVRDPFAGNILPPGRLDPNAIKLLDLYPAPNNPGLFNNYAADPILRNDTNQFDIRIDSNISEKDSIFGSVSYANNPVSLPGPFPGIADGGSFADGDQHTIAINGVVSETHVFSPTLINVVRAGVSRMSANRLQPNADTKGIPAQFGIQGVPQVASNGGLGSIFISGLTTLGSNQFLPSIEYNTTLQFNDDVTKHIGNQSLKAGFETQIIRFSIFQPFTSRGAWNFSGSYVGVPNNGGGNTGLAQMLLTPIPGTVPGAFNYVGGADTVQFSNIANTDMYHHYFGTYFQDDYKITPKLTLNLGVRWDYFGQIVERYGAQSNFLPSGSPSSPSEFLMTKKRCNTPLSPDVMAAFTADNVNLVCSSVPGLGKSQLGNFSPRFGFAYRITNKLVARGGYGLFYGGFENSVLETYNDFPFQFNLDYPQLVPNAPITFPNGSIATLETGVTGIPVNPAQVEPGGLTLIGEDYHKKTPYTQGYNFTLEYQLSRSDTVSAGYVGNTVRHLGSYIDANSPGLILPPGLNEFNYTAFPDFPTYLQSTSFAGNSFYNSLQINYKRRFRAGLAVLANFTWSACRTDATSVLNETAISYRAALLPGFGIHGDYGRCDFDVPKAFHFSGQYQLPVGHGRKFLAHSNGVVNAIVGGWSTNWILTLEDGQPGTVGCAISTTSGLGCNALLVPGQGIYAGAHNVNHWLNPNAFASPPVATTIGQTDYSPLGGAPTQFFGPGFHRLDFSLFKNFQINERFRLEFRSEFFNLTNTPNFSPPGFGGNGVVSAPGALDYTNPTTFGTINSTRDGQNDQREIQFALKLYW